LKELGKGLFALQDYEPLERLVEERAKRIIDENYGLRNSCAIGVKDTAEEVGIPSNDPMLLLAIYDVASKYKIRVEDRDRKPGLLDG
jgi:hypothetical protein